MNVLEAIKGRRAVRSYQERIVDRSTILTLLDAAIQAPSAVNDQPWAFVVIQDRALLHRLSEQAKGLMLQSEEWASLDPRFQEMVSGPSFDIFYNAGTLIVIWAKPGDLSGDRSAWDCCFAAENLMLAACGLGLGTCPIGFAWPLLEREATKRELGVPVDYVPVVPLIVGYPAGATAPVPRRKPDILSWKAGVDTALPLIVEMPEPAA